MHQQKCGRQPLRYVSLSERQYARLWHKAAEVTEGKQVSIHKRKYKYSVAGSTFMDHTFIYAVCHECITSPFTNMKERS
jgi:hypothetical protein